MPSAKSNADATRSRVRTSLANSGLAQREFARRIGLDETKLSKALNGTRRFAPAELVQIANTAGVTVNWLISGSDYAVGPAATPAAEVLPTRHRENREQAARRREIIEASWRLIADKGYRAVRVADIAGACGISSAAVHYYFATKRQILDEALRYSVKLAFDRQVAELPAIDDSVRRLKHLIRLQLPTPGEGRVEWSIWLQIWNEVAVGGASADNHSQAYDRWQQTVQETIAAGQRQGLFAATPAVVLAVELTSMFDGLGIRVLTGLLDAGGMQTHIERFIDRNIVIGSTP